MTMGQSSDRNMLLGIFALQMDFINREQLLSAMTAWVMRKSTPLEEILQEFKALTQDTVLLLQALVAKHLELHGNSAQQSLQAISSIGQLREELRSLADPDIDATLSVVAGGPTPNNVDKSTLPHQPKKQHAANRFRVIRPHAKGGLGEVFLARDTELNREVALKEIQERFAKNEDSRSRFMLEAEVTGGLEHPGIVPVYGLGQYADGRPFYAMRFIKGDSLREAIDRFHAKHRGSKAFATGEIGVEFRQLLGRFIDVCQAIEYAHSRGVLHRDLKPGNIMLGKYGETLVVDWGLAKVIGRTEQNPSSGETALSPEVGNGSAPTQIGSAIGTPAFMSPEQAAGNLDALGPSADVYSLGATLYCLLTGKTPFYQNNAEDIFQLLERVKRGKFERPKDVYSGIPASLEAICMKAMSNRPNDRYTSPSKLADDIEHWLADEPIGAWPEPPLHRLRRWARKNPAIVTGGVATLIIGFISSVAISILVSQYASKLSISEHIANESSANAKKSEQLAKTALIRQVEQAQHASSNLFTSALVYQKYGDISNSSSSITEAINLRTSDDPKRKDYLAIAYDILSRNGRCLTSMRSDEPIKTAQFSKTGSGVVVVTDHSISAFHSITGESLFNPIMYPEGIADFAISRDGERIVVASIDGTTRLWSLVEGKSLCNAMKNKSPVSKLAFSDDGGLAAFASFDGETSFLNGYDGSVRSISLNTPKLLSSIALSSNGSNLITVAPYFDDSASTTLLRTLAGERRRASHWEAKIWSVELGRPIGKSMKHIDAITEVVFSPNRQFIATASMDNTSRIWNAGTGEPESEPLVHTSWVNSLSFSPNGKLLATSSRNIVQLWDLVSGESIGKPLVHEDSVEFVGFHPGGAYIATSTDKSQTQFWNTNEQKPICDPFPSSFKEFSNDGSRFLTESKDRVFVWDFGSFFPLWQGVESVSGIALSPSGNALAAGRVVPDPQGIAPESDSTLLLWNFHERSYEKREIKLSGPLNRFMFSPSGNAVLTISRDAIAQLWDSQTGLAKGPPLKHVTLVGRATFSPDGRFVATESQDKFVRFWNAETSLPVGTRIKLPGFPSNLEFSKSGTLVAATIDSKIFVWNTATGKSLTAPMEHGQKILSISFGNDEQLLYSASEDRSLQWNCASGMILQEASGPFGIKLLYSDDATKLISISPSGPRIFNSKDGKALGEKIPEVDGCRYCAIAGDGNRIATGGKRGQIWDTKTGAPIFATILHPSFVNSISLNGTGTKVAIASDSLVQVWDLNKYLPEDFQEFEERFSLTQALNAEGKFDSSDRLIEYAEKMQTSYHASSAHRAIDSGDYESTRFHLRYLIEREPDESTWQELTKTIEASSKK
jgi:WD40 repeat protein